jgi:hypothetical protein
VQDRETRYRGENGHEYVRVNGEQHLRRAQWTEAARERRLMADAIGVDSHDILVDLQMVGYKADTIGLLELALPVQIAWADGSISKRERDVILQIGARECLIDGSRGYAHLNCWLDSPPCDQLFNASIRAIRAMLDALQPGVREALRRKLVGDCTAVAAASDDFLYEGQISNDEQRRVLDHIAAALEHRGDSS